MDQLDWYRKEFDNSLKPGEPQPITLQNRFHTVLAWLWKGFLKGPWALFKQIFWLPQGLIWKVGKTIFSNGIAIVIAVLGMIYGMSSSKDSAPPPEPMQIYVEAPAANNNDVADKLGAISDRLDTLIEQNAVPLPLSPEQLDTNSQPGSKDTAQPFDVWDYLSVFIDNIGILIKAFFDKLLPDFLVKPIRESNAMQRVEAMANDTKDWFLGAAEWIGDSIFGILEWIFIKVQEMVGKAIG